VHASAVIESRFFHQRVVAPDLAVGFRELAGRGLRDMLDLPPGPAPIGRPAVMDLQIAVVVAEDGTVREVTLVPGHDHLRLASDNLEARQVPLVCVGCPYVLLRHNRLDSS
jgi:hypothetical protein